MTSNFADSELNLADDCFELVSAYIDGELSLAEKQQVQTWIDQDPQVKAFYAQLLALQSQMQHSVAPPSDKSVVEITAEVFATIDVERRRTRQRKLVWGSGAIAASLLAALTGMIPGINPAIRMAQKSAPNTGAVMLAVAVNKPAIDIPKGIADYNLESP